MSSDNRGTEADDNQRGPENRHSASHWCHQCSREIAPMMAPNPICPRCHGDFVEEIQADNDPRDFLADFSGGEEEDEMENEFGGAGNYNQDLQSMLQDILAHMMGRASNAGNAAGNAGTDGTAASSGSAGPEASETAEHGAMPGDLPSDNIFVSGASAASAGEQVPRSQQSSSTSSAGDRHIPGMRTWTSNIGGHQMSFSVASLSSDEVAGMANAAQRRADGSGVGDRSPQTNSEESQRRPMFIDPEENAPLNIGSLMTSILSALGGAGRGEGGPMFGVPVGNLGDYVWGQSSFDDVITRIMEQNPTAHAPPPASDEQIGKLPARVISDQEVAAHKECGICMEEYQNKEQVVELPCAHFYHKECIDHWLKMNGTCPICRKRIEDEDAAGGQPPHVHEHSELPGSFPSTQQQQQAGTNASTASAPTAAAAHEPSEPESEPLD
ncbi:hypothetical protein FB645_002623 [Coemansia sp. IMI 203386]|nr:hypothetical protein FB645_002623 [Coemansia sp. IMI 203386]